MNPSINRRVTRTVTVLAAGAVAALGTAGGAQAITLPTVGLAQLVSVANPVAIGGAGTSDRGTAPTGTAPVDAVGSLGAGGGATANSPGTTHDGPVATGSTSDLGSPGTTQDGTAATGGAA